MLPLPSDLYVSRPLTNVSIGYAQDQAGFIAQQAFPLIPVQLQGGQITVQDPQWMLRDEMEVRAPGTESVGTEWKPAAPLTYFAPVRAIHHDIHDQQRANAEIWDLDQQATELVTMKDLIRKEVIFASSFMTGSVWGTTVTGVSGTPTAGQFKQWNDEASDPLADIATGRATIKAATGFAPNTLVLGWNVIEALKRHPDFLDRIKYGGNAGNPAMVNNQALAALFEVENVLVMSALYNSAKEGVAASYAFIGGKTALLMYRQPNPGLLRPSAGYTFSWRGYLGTQTNGNRIKRFRIERLASDRVELENAFDMKLIAASLGYFFASAVA